MQFQVLAKDFEDPEAFNRRLKVREEHLKLSNELKLRGQVLFGVAHLDSSEKMIGSTMIVDFPSRSDLDAWLKVEPYVTSKVWDKIEITLCRVGPSFLKTK